MEKIDLVYNELREARKEIAKIRDDLASFKLKVVIYAAIVGTVTGGGTAKILSALKLLA